MATTSFLASSRCPIELLSEIFLHCGNYPSLSVVDGKSAPLLLLRVCRRWNEVALASPRLWSNFVIRMQSPGCIEMIEQWIVLVQTMTPEERYLSRLNGPEDDQDIEFLHFQFGAFQRWIERSRSAPLACMMVPGDTNTHIRRGIYFQYLSVLVRHSWHWEDITFLALPSRLPESLSSDSPVSKLRTISLTEPSGLTRKQGLDPSLLTALQSARKLQDFSSSGYNSWTWALPWAQLTRLRFCKASITAADVDVIVNVISQCTKLHSLSLDVNSPPAPPSLVGDVGRTTLIHPTLQQIEISTNMGFVHSMLSRLTFSSLQRLQISESNFLDEPPVTSPLDLLRPLGASSHTLQEVHLKLRQMSLDDAVEVIKPFHALFSLQTPHSAVSGGQNSAKFVAKMTLRFDSSGRMISGQNPLLKILDISLSSAFLNLEDQFVDMIESRWRLPPLAATPEGGPVHRLRNLWTTASFVVELKKKKPEAYERLLSFEDEGMQITRYKDTSHTP